jgi:hypothetical protein
MSPLINSRFLQDLRSHFARPCRGSLPGLLEYCEEPPASVLDESLEILCNVGRGHELFMYQTLTVWGDQVATFSVRESVKKRMYRLVYTLREFPLCAAPGLVVAAFWSSRELLSTLSVPPGEAEADREALRRIEQYWLDLSSENTH